MKFAGDWVELENIVQSESPRPRKTFILCPHLNVDIHKVRDNHAVIHRSKKAKKRKAQERTCESHSEVETK